MELYEPVVLHNLQTEHTAFYSTGSAATRIQKLEWLSELPLAVRYLHPCIYALRDNCGKCGKCVRTQAALYVLGKLERFSGVFDLAQFEKNKNVYFSEIMMKEQQHLHCAEIMERCRKNKIRIPVTKRQLLWVKLRKKARALKKYWS